MISRSSVQTSVLISTSICPRLTNSILGIYITILENNYQTHVIVFFVQAKQEKCDQKKKLSEDMGLKGDLS